jgi:hypothetical protein
MPDDAYGLPGPRTAAPTDARQRGHRRAAVATRRPPADTSRAIQRGGESLRRFAPWPPTEESADAKALRQVVDDAYKCAAPWPCALDKPPHAAEPWSALLDALMRDPTMRLPR